MPIAKCLTSSSKCSIIPLNNYTNERAKLPKGSDAKPRVKSSKGHDSRATESTSKRLLTIVRRFLISEVIWNELISHNYNS